jgi:hypothetical protein
MTKRVIAFMGIVALTATLGTTTAQAVRVLDSETGATPLANAILRGGTPYRHVTARAFSDAANVLEGKLQWRCGERNARGDFQIRVKLRENITVNPYSRVRRVPSFVRNSARADAYCNMRIWAVGDDGTVDSTVTISASRQ